MNMPTAETNPQKQELVIIRTFTALRDLVWKSWTDPVMFALWYGLPNSTLYNVVFDVRPGGSWHAIMRIPDAPDMPWKGDFLEVVKPEKLVFALSDPENLDNPDREIVTVTFEQLDGKTRIIFRQTGNLPPEEYRDGLRKGWTTFFDRLEQLFKSMKRESEL